MFSICQGARNVYWMEFLLALSHLLLSSQPCSHNLLWIEIWSYCRTLAGLWVWASPTPGILLSCFNTVLGRPSTFFTLLVQFSLWVVSNCLWPHGLQHTRPPCPSPTPGACSNSYPLSRWWHPTISSSVIPFSSCLPSFPVSWSFLKNQFFASGGQSWSFSFSINPSNEYSGLISFRMDWLDLLAVQGTLKSLLQHHSSKASVLWCSAFFTVQLSHPYMTTGKTIALSRGTFVGKVMFFFFNMLVLHSH